MVNDERKDEPQGDAADLRAQLKLAQDRLATYQKFDRDIAENVRRSSELMLEAMQVRDRMEGEATEQARASRARLSNRLQALEDDLGTVQAQVTAMLDRVAELRHEFATEPGEHHAPKTTSEAGENAPGVSMLGDGPVIEQTDEPVLAAASGPIAIDVIATGMTRAASALALQSHLRSLDQVQSVDAREFSSGVLRLQLEVVGEIADADLVGWTADDDVTVFRHPDNAIELRIGE